MRDADAPAAMFALYPTVVMTSFLREGAVRARGLLPLVLCLIATGCKKEVVAAAVPGSLVLVQGNLQQIQAGLELPNPIVVRLLDDKGAPIEKFAVGFNVMIGGGAVSPASVVTDVNGEAKTKWALGPVDVQQSLQVRVAGLEPMQVSAIGLVPGDLVIAQGNNQIAKAGAALPNPVVIRVVGPNNTPMKGIAVAFQVVTGGGLISPQSALTNALGEVTVRWTLGTAIGLNTLSVSSGSLQAITLNAAGTA